MSLKNVDEIVRREEKRLSRVGRIGAIAKYELKRSIAKKKVLLMIILVILVQLGVLTLLYYVWEELPHQMPIELPSNHMWIIGAFAPGFFFTVMVILVAAGLISEEYERGTVEVLFSKPSTRIEVALGKYLGGLIIVAAIVPLIYATSTIFAEVAFGPQYDLDMILILMGATFYSSLTFYSLTFLLSETTKRTIISTLIPIVLVIVLPIADPLLEFLGGEGFETVRKILPTWSTQLPSFVASDIITFSDTLPQGSPFELGWGDSTLAFILILIYTLAFTFGALLHLRRIDITKPL